jgi:hypothetical protein
MFDFRGVGKKFWEGDFFFRGGGKVASDRSVSEVFLLNLEFMNLSQVRTCYKIIYI